jgi:cytoplasmic iron level regulating protein YaaA (DUF328/UPF0246 family)
MPMFVQESSILLEKLKSFVPWELESILDTNEKLAFKAFVELQDFDFDNKGSPAMFAYDGLVYKYLEPEKLSNATIERSQEMIRIISAFYGLLRPLDLILPYRLEMRSKLKIDGRNLYDFWGDKIYNSLFSNESCVINLASEEYAKAIRKYLKPNCYMKKNCQTLTDLFMLIKLGNLALRFFLDNTSVIRYDISMG